MAGQALPDQAACTCNRPVIREVDRLEFFDCAVHGYRALEAERDELRAENVKYDDALTAAVEEQERLRSENEALKASVALWERRFDAWQNWRVFEGAGALDEQRAAEPCGRLLVGQGSDTYDPLCVLEAGHTGVCKPEEGTHG